MVPSQNSPVPIDKGSVGIIAEDPTCEAWGRVAREYSAQAQAVNWSGRDQSVPASAWTPEQRTTYETVGKGMTSAADQTVNLVKLTPHRVMRELYEQFIAYARAFTDRIPTYTANDGYLAGTTDAITSGLAAICSAIDYRSAPTIAPLIPEAAPPSVISTPRQPDNPQRFLTIADPRLLGVEFGIDEVQRRHRCLASNRSEYPRRASGVRIKRPSMMRGTGDGSSCRLPRTLGRRSNYSYFARFCNFVRAVLIVHM